MFKFITMSLHPSKSIAILQWCNCLSSCSLVSINQLSDGKLFCDILHSVFNVSTVEPSVKRLRNDSSEEELHSTDEKESGALNPSNIGSKSEEVLQSSNVEQVESVELQQINNENESEKLQQSNVENKLEELQSSSIETESGKLQQNSSSVEKESTDIKFVDVGSAKEAEDAELNVMEVSKNVLDEDSDDTIELTEDFTKNFEDSKVSDVAKPSEPADEETKSIYDVMRRYKILQKFIDEYFLAESDLFINYTSCMNSNEMELAKVAVFILAAIVRHYLLTKNDQLNTLTLLEHRVQEDIQECLSLLFQDISNISNTDLQKILSRPAKYKVSPEKRHSFVTPQRTCSSKYRKPVSSLSTSYEEVFSNSPLKSFLESPHLLPEMYISKDKEVKEIRKHLYTKEIENEDLIDELKSTKMMMKEKEKEIEKLKQSKMCEHEDEQAKCEHEDEQETKECTTCKIYEKEIECLKREKSEVKMLLEEAFKEHETEASYLTSKITMLEGKIKREVDKTVERVLKEKDERYEMVQEEVLRLQALLQETKTEYAKSLSLCQEKLAETTAVSKTELESPVQGECIGKVIENEEMKLLRFKLQEAEKKIESLQKKEQPAVPVKVESDSRNLEQMPITSTPDNAEGHNLRKRVHNNSSDIQSDKYVSSCDSSFEKQSVPKRKRGRPRKKIPALVTNDSVGALWAQYDSEGEVAHGSSVNNGLTKNTDLFMQLGNGVAELFEKLKFVKKLFTSLKLMVAPNGSNGFVNLQTLSDFEQNLTSAEDYVSCLFHIVEYHVSFQKNLSKDTVSTDKISKCDQPSHSVIFECLKKEIEHLKASAEKSEKQHNATLKAKMDDMEILKQELCSTTQAYQECLKSKEAIGIQFKSKCSEYERLKCKLDDVLSHTSKLEKQYVTAVTEWEKRCNRAQKKAREKSQQILALNSTTEKLMTAVRKYKEEKKDVDTKYQNLRLKCCSLQAERNELEEQLNKLQADKIDLENRVSHLQLDKSDLEKQIWIRTSEIEEMNEKLQQLQDRRAKEEGCNIELPANDIKTMLKEPNMEIYKLAKQEFRLEKSSKVVFVIPDIHMINNSSEAAPRDPGNESSLSGALVNRSLQSCLHTAYEEDFVNESSIAEINRNYNVVDERSQRLQELRRRNTLCLPHLQSSYPVETNNMSPFNKSVYLRLREKESHAAEENEVPGQSNTQVVKKRKLSEVEHENKTNSTTLPATPKVKFICKFKTPLSLRKMLDSQKNRRSRFVKPKP